MKLNLVHSPGASVVQVHEKLHDKAVRRVQFPPAPAPPSPGMNMHVLCVRFLAVSFFSAVAGCLLARRVCVCGSVGGLG